MSCLIEKNSSRRCLGASIEIVIPVKTGLNTEFLFLTSKGQNKTSEIPRWPCLEIVGFKKFFIQLKLGKTTKLNHEFSLGLSHSFVAHLDKLDITSTRGDTKAYNHNDSTYPKNVDVRLLNGL